MDTVQT